MDDFLNVALKKRNVLLLGCIWEDNIKMVSNNWEYGDWIIARQNREKKQAVVKTEMNLWVP